MNEHTHSKNTFWYFSIFILFSQKNYSPDRPFEEDESEAEAFLNAEKTFQKNNKNGRKSDWLRNTITLEITTETTNTNTTTYSSSRTSTANSRTMTSSIADRSERKKKKKV